jgi:hypothetical protein
MTMTRIRMGLLPGLLLVLALALAGCGGGGNDGNDGVASLGGADKATTTTSPAGGDFKQQALAYARCMRQHGINMPDPKFDAQGRLAQQNPPGLGPGDPKFDAAEQACKQYLPGGGEPEKPDPQLQQQMVAYARCMRQHGINLPDPKLGEGINVDGGKGVNPNDPKFKAADQACQQYVPKGAGEKQTQQQSAGGGSQ